MVKDPDVCFDLRLTGAVNIQASRNFGFLAFAL
jgi:hypothetical protein